MVFGKGVEYTPQKGTTKEDLGRPLPPQDLGVLGKFYFLLTISLRNSKKYNLY